MPAVVVVGNGFIGSHVVRHLQSRGEPVVAVDVRASDDDRSGVRVVELDLFDSASLARVLEETSASAVILSAGAVPSAERYSPDDAWRVNVDGSLAVAQAALRAGTPRLVYVSSVAVYGSPPVERITEDCPAAPVTDYGRMKTAAEAALQEACRGLDLKLARVCGVYGAATGAGGAGYWPRFLAAAAAHLAASRSLTVRSSGFAGDEIIYVKDLAAALVSLATTDGRPHTIVNVGTGRVVSAVDLCDALRSAFPQSTVVLEGAAEETRGGPPLDVRRLAAAYGFHPRYSLRDGVCDLVGELAAVRANA